MRSSPFKLPDPGECVGVYRVLEKVGQGGQGHVFKAEYQGRFFALKFFQARPTAPRGERELDILRRLESPHVVRVLGYGRWPDPQQGFLYFVMEWVEGLTLEEHARTHGLTAREAVGLFWKVARALQEIHARGVLHLDVKPDNVLVKAEDKEPMVVDFGVGRLEGFTTVEGKGQLAGTPEFYSPQAYDFLWENFGCGVRYRAEVPDEVWALGVTMYQVLTGVLPFGSRHEGHLVRDVRTKAPEAPHERNPRVPVALSQMCLRLLEKKVEDRYADMAAVGAALEEVVTGAQRDSSWEVPLRAPELRLARRIEEAPVAVEPDAPAPPSPMEEEEPAQEESLSPDGKSNTWKPTLSRWIPTMLGLLPVRATVLGALMRMGLLALALGAIAQMGLWLLSVRVQGSNTPSLGGERTTSAPSGLTGKEPTSDTRVFREMATAGRSTDSALGASPYMRSPPMSEFAYAMLRPQETHPKPEVTPNRPAPAPRKARGCVPIPTNVCVAGVCSLILIGCTSTQQVVLPTASSEPPPEACPAGSQETAARFGIPLTPAYVSLPGERKFEVERILVNEGPLVVKSGYHFGTMPVGSLIYGKIWFSKKRFFGRFTQAKTPDGTVHPICMEISTAMLSHTVDANGVCEAGPGFCVLPESRPGAVRIGPVFYIKSVSHFE